MKFILPFTFLLCAFLGTINAQDLPPVVDKTKYKIVFQLTSSDTMTHKSLIRNLKNVLKDAPNAQIEVVCHSDGLLLLVAKETKQAAGIAEYAAKGVLFVACENTMRSHKIKREDLVKECGTVPNGVLEVVKKQGKKWAYIKAG